MELLALLFAGFTAGLIVWSMVLRWVTALIGSGSNDASERYSPGKQAAQRLLLSLAHSGFWVLVVTCVGTYSVLSNPHEAGWNTFLLAFYAALLLLIAVAISFASAAPRVLFVRVVIAMSNKRIFMRFVMAVACVVNAPLLLDWAGKGEPWEFLLFAGALMLLGAYLLGLYMWQLVGPALLSRQPKQDSRQQ